MPKLTIDGIAIEVEEGTSILQACEQAGIEIPRFCYHDRLSVAASCRMCMVEVEKMPKVVPSCALPCAEGMVVHTSTKAVGDARKSVMELLLINHPLDCPVCDQGGECDLQDQAMCYGSDRSRYSEPRRVVENKDLGPLIKTEMTRCIHCTRCVRFLDEIAGVPELGGLFRGEHMEISNAYAGPLTSELSGNLADICPVGALTAKPYAFRARSWEYAKTESIDVLDAVGSNIRIDARGNEVMRILPRLNEDVNEEWISDKTRFAFDGLKHQRLDQPYVRIDGTLRPVTWEEALDVAAQRLKGLAAEQIAAIAGDLADCESLFALKSLMKELDSPHLDCRQDGSDYDISSRAHYIMNSGIAGIEKADAILLIGTNPRHEAAIINARIYKRWKTGGVRIGLIGVPADLGYSYRHIGNSPTAISEVAEGRHEFSRILSNAKNPVVIVGAGALARNDGAAIHLAVLDLAIKFNVLRTDWNGFNVLQLAASRVGGLDLGFVPQAYGMDARSILGGAAGREIAAVYLLGADEIDTKKLGNAFVIYQGHHGDAGAQRADVIFPGAAYTEKEAIYVNTEGRPQLTKRAVFPPGNAKEDWKIIRALSGAIGKAFPFDDAGQLRACMFKAHPHLGNIGCVEHADIAGTSCVSGKFSAKPFAVAVGNFYMTDAVCRASPTMFKCTEEILPLVMPEGK